MCSNSTAHNPTNLSTLIHCLCLVQIKNPRVSHTQMRGRLADTSVLRLSQVRWVRLGSRRDAAVCGAAVALLWRRLLRL